MLTGCTGLRSRSQPHAALTGSGQRFQIELGLALPAPAAVVFPHLHVPRELRWLGRFQLVRRGVDPRTPSGLGSTRRVTILVPIVEETITGFSPPSELTYSVTYSRAYARHRASIRLSSVSETTALLRWTVTFDSLRRRPLAHARFTLRYLRRALRRLERHLRRGLTHDVVPSR